MVMDAVIEEKSPKGITIKILVDKSKFLAFDRKGGSIYADANGTRVLHDIPVIIFIGEEFIIPRHDRRADMSLLKVLKEKVLVPFAWKNPKKQKYLFIYVEPRLDLMPVKIKKVRDVAELVKDLEAGAKPDYLVVDNTATREDIIIIKNRYPAAKVVLADESADIVTVDHRKDMIDVPSDRRATDIVREININMMSNNPVFLARLHLRELNFSKVNQLLFDFDLSEGDSEYILAFLNTMIRKAGMKEELAHNLNKIESLKSSFLFYMALLNKNDGEVRTMIKNARDITDIASFRTLLAKIKTLFPGQADLLLFTDYENLLFERNESLRS